MDQERAVVLLSGGIDSSTVAALAGAKGYEVYALTIEYGQRHAVELVAAARVAKALKVARHVTVSVDLRAFGHSALTDSIDVPKNRPEIDRVDEIPVTYVPARNTVFLSLALAWAETLGANRIFIGANAIDYSGYPDCRPEFIAAFETLANVATKAGMEGTRFHIEAPLLRMTKAEIILLGQKLGFDYALTHSCYDPTPEGLACGACDSCLIRKRGFLEAKIPDPTHYADTASAR